MKIQINVTQEDINCGRPKDCAECPIARAVSRNLSAEFSPDIGPHDVDIYDDEGDIVESLGLPKEAILFIEKFDAYGAEAVEPFSFEIDIPEIYLKNA